MSFNATQFLEGLRRGSEAYRRAGLLAVQQYAEHVLGDAQQLCPVLTGALQASGNVAPVEFGLGSISVTIGFNTDYAAAVHERLTNFFSGVTIVHPVGQAKFLEVAMRENATKFAAFVSDRLQNVN